MTPDQHNMPDDALIHAWLDGALDPGSPGARRARAALDGDPALAARIEREREAGNLLASALNAYARTTNAGRLTPGIERAVARAGLTDRVTRAGFAAALALALFSGGWFTHALTSAAPVSPDASAMQLAYFDGERALSSASLESADLHEPVISPPSLAGHGLNLTAVETRSVRGGVMNQMEYQRSDGAEIRILVRRENRFRDEAVTTSRLNGEPLVYWRDGDMTVGVTGAVSERELESIALDVREQTRPAFSGPALAERAAPEPETQVQTVSENTLPPG